MRCFILTSILLVTWAENVAGFKCSFVAFLSKPCSHYWGMVGSFINIETINVSDCNGFYFHEDYNAQFWFWLCWREMLLHLYCQSRGCWCCWSVMSFMQVFVLSRVPCSVLKGGGWQIITKLSTKMTQFKFNSTTNCSLNMTKSYNLRINRFSLTVSNGCEK